jgi:hypothetical protein
VKNISFFQGSTIDKVTKSRFRRLCEHIYGENVSERTLLLVVSWACHEAQETVKIALARKYVDVLPTAERTCV